MFPIIDKLGGWERVEPVLRERGVKTNDHAVRKWRDPDRGMPWQAKYVLAMEARRQEIEFSDVDFLLSEEAGAA